jgi:hypothetical protein
MAKKKEEHPADNIKRVKFTQSLKVPLTTDEIADRADRAAHLVASIQAKEDELKAVVKHHKSIIESEMVTLDLHSKEVRDKTTYRQVDCERQYDFNAGKYREIRNDTGEVMNERRLLESEKQMELPFDEEGMPLTEENVKAALQHAIDDSWREVPIFEALGSSLGKRANDALENAGIDTMGKFADFQAKHGEWWSKELKGIGPETVTKLCDAAERFWASRQPNATA